MVTRKNTSNLNAQYGMLPPQAIDVEEAVLGALMLENDAYLSISGILREESFYKEENREIFKAIETMFTSNNVIDLLTVTQYLKNNELLDKIGGPFYITQLTSKVSSAAHLEFHARIISQKFMQREVIRVCSGAIKDAYDDSLDVDGQLISLMSSIEDISGNVPSGIRYMKAVVTSTIDEIESDCAKTENGETPGIPSTLKELNRAIGGFKFPNYIVMGARPGVGKTTIGWNFAITAAKNGHWVNFYTYEMTSEALCKIDISAESGVDRTGIRDGRLNSNDWSDINSIVEDISELPIIIYDDPTITATKIRANTHKNKKNGECEFVIIDYIQLVPPDDSKDNREQQVSKTSKTFKRITLTDRIPVMALAQLNRAVESRSDPETFPGDLRESGSLEQDADMILLPYNVTESDGFGDDKIIQRIFKIGKNRNGSTGSFEYTANRQMTRISDLEVQIENEFNPNAGIEPSRNFEEDF